ncbi:hypothetical protein Cgig2_007846 [Carnegiea gigantea]|uniref:Leucine-rich repeat-containing N-terminal plant-type domain-containing protein n=1 Tax=Carnegiea gigantea TaxID=171969 RepID=A0A9Q1GTR9_9CARY|nr:hypothetical protein Cgig2_007846 [Carnegiea gigantea]
MHKHGQALLEIKSAITEDPDNALSSWNELTNYCKWRGVTCDGNNVVALDLSGLKLARMISPAIGASSMMTLVSLSFAHSDFHGTIPTTMRWLTSPVELDFFDNQTEGKIPVFLQTFPCSSSEGNLGLHSSCGGGQSGGSQEPGGRSGGIGGGSGGSFGGFGGGSDSSSRGSDNSSGGSGGSAGGSSMRLLTYFAGGLVGWWV